MLKTILCLMLLIMGTVSCNRSGEQQVWLPPKKFPSSTKAYKTVDNLPYMAWWQQFNDSELNHLIEAGLKNNMDVHIAIGNLQQAQGELKQVKLSWLPLVQIFAGYSTNPALGAPGAFYGVWPYYFVNIMKLYSQQKQAKFNVEIRRAAVDGMRLALIGQIASSYFTLMAQLEQLKLLQQLDKDLKSLIRLSQGEIKIGLENDINLAQLQTDERLIVAQMKPVLSNIVLSKNALRYLINENPGPIKNKNNFAQLDFLQVKPGSLPASVLNNRPELKMAFYALKASRTGIQLAYSDFFPGLQLDDFIGEVHLPNSHLAQATDAYVNWTIAPSTLGAIAASKGAYHSKIAEFNKILRRILQEVDNDFAANRRLNEKYKTYLYAEKDYRHKYNLQQGLLKQG